MYMVGIQEPTISNDIGINLLNRISLYNIPRKQSGFCLNWCRIRAALYDKKGEKDLDITKGKYTAE